MIPAFITVILVLVAFVYPENKRNAFHNGKSCLSRRHTAAAGISCQLLSIPLCPVSAPSTIRNRSEYIKYGNRAQVNHHAAYITLQRNPTSGCLRKLQRNHRYRLQEVSLIKIMAICSSFPMRKGRSESAQRPVPNCHRHHDAYNIRLSCPVNPADSTSVHSAVRQNNFKHHQVKAAVQCGIRKNQGKRCIIYF